MRKFRFTGLQKEKHISYLIDFAIGENYSEDRRAFRDSPLTIQDAALMYPEDWQEVTEPELIQLPSLTKREYFAGLMLQSLIPVCKDLPDHKMVVFSAIEMADKLLKQLENGKS